MTDPHVHISATGELDLTIHDPLNAIGIENITDLVSYEITHEAGAILHLIRFRSGGLFRFLCMDTGEIKELSGEGICWTLTEDHRILLRDGAVPSVGFPMTGQVHNHD
jgi:hypothetical protein